MFSRLAAVFIACLLFGSAFASYGQVRSSAPPAGAQVVEAILSADPAQRDDAGSSSEQEPQDESTAASQMEGGSDFPEGLAPLAEPLLPALAMPRPRPLAAAAWLAPTLDGLRRPPRADLFAA